MEDDLGVREIESLCFNCREQGVTKLLFTSIPFFREIVLMSFRCEHCGFSNNELRPAGEIQVKGGVYDLKITCKEDFDRQVVKSEHAIVEFSGAVELEIPKGKGQLTTIESFLRTAMDELRESQGDRRKVAPDVADKVDTFISQLALVLAGQCFPFHFKLHDISGNSFVENPVAPKEDPHLKYTPFLRSSAQNNELGIYDLDAPDLQAHREEEAKKFQAPEGATLQKVSETGEEERDTSSKTVSLEREVYELPSDCPTCGAHGTSKSCITDLPFFKEIVIMAFDCERCGYKTNEVKGGGKIPEKGRIITLSVPKREADNIEEWEEDMRRDVVKSNTAGIRIPELDLEIALGSLGGLYTTVEGLLNLAHENLFSGHANEMLHGDSAKSDTMAQRFDDYSKRFKSLINGEIAYSLEIRDPLANSYIYSPCAPEPEPKLVSTDYERTFEENEDLGLNDMNTDHYDEESLKTYNQENLVHAEKLNEKNTHEKMTHLQKGGKETHPHFPHLNE